MNEHILDFLFKIVATRSLVIFFFVFSWYVSNHFCNLSFPWRLNSRRKCIIAGFMTEEIGENMFPLLRWDASGAQHQLVGVTKPLAFLIQSPCFHWTTASDFKQPLSTSPPTGGLNEIIWRSKHVEISSETVTITAWFVSLSSLVCLLLSVLYVLIECAQRTARNSPQLLLICCSLTLGKVYACVQPSSQRNRMFELCVCWFGALREVKICIGFQNIRSNTIVLDKREGAQSRSRSRSRHFPPILCQESLNMEMGTYAKTFSEAGRHRHNTGDILALSQIQAAKEVFLWEEKVMQ